MWASKQGASYDTFADWRYESTVKFTEKFEMRD